MNKTESNFARVGCYIVFIDYYTKTYWSNIDMKINAMFCHWNSDKNFPSFSLRNSRPSGQYIAFRNMSVPEIIFDHWHRRNNINNIIITSMISDNHKTEIISKNVTRACKDFNWSLFSSVLTLSSSRCYRLHCTAVNHSREITKLWSCQYFSFLEQNSILLPLGLAWDLGSYKQ